MTIVNVNDINQINSFIESANYEMASYLYKLPQAHSQFDAFLNDVIDNPGVYALQNSEDQMTMMLLAFPYETNKYKVIGPLINPNTQYSIEDFNRLFKAMTNDQPDSTNFNFSFENSQQYFYLPMKTIGASYSFTDYYLETSTDVGEIGTSQNITEYHPAYYRSFNKLHNNTFTHDVMTSSEIINSLQENNHLFTFMSEGLLKGYVYLQVSKNHQTAEIKYFASHADYRFKGIAFELLKYVLHFAFQNYDVKKIYFKIRSKNNKLVERFNELGFNVNHEFKKYKFVKAYQ
ncbi:GNAT family N-acetyltransferase [Staphylococcus durrellii]|uniref:GNAT family N-acetyltransferase n=1 Tax=Staphylococcus durrellii TaxID=2781773 RepID=UPI00189E2569|nr:GNAT family N-acetyltransferase [Staphylococcus durrellii]MBF7016457.1 GNAT family N-acetyltransferase [Staphylococcus durrellii]